MPKSGEHMAQEKQKPQAPAQSELAGAYVLRLLGRPADLTAVQARHLWGNNFRVNIVVGADAASRKIAHSFFLALDGDGKVLWSQPTIHREYAAPTTEVLRSEKSQGILAAPVQKSDEGATPPG
jgi:hypothetical protein